MKQITLSVIVFLISLWFWSSLVLATGKTNVNEVNDLFDRHIENKDQLMRNLQEQREGAVRDIQTGKGPQHIEGINEAESKARELESIREVDLESSGRQKRASEEYRFYDDNELEPDYSKPGNIEHKKDCDEIVSQTGIAMKKLGKDLKTKLSALGIDCHQVQGTTTKDLTYHIEIKEEEHKNSEYEQVFCEEPRNRYNCHDVLTIKCTRTAPVGGMKHILKVSRGNNGFVDQLLQGTRALGYSDEVILMQLYGWSLPLHLYNQNHFYNPPIGLVADMTPYSSVIKNIISQDINTGKIIVPPHRWYWPEFKNKGLKARHHQMAVQKITGEWSEKPISTDTPYIKLYYYDEQCIEWSEDWSETCILQ